MKYDYLSLNTYNYFSRFYLSVAIVIFVSISLDAFAQRAYDRPANEIPLRGNGAASGVATIAALADGSVIAGGYFSNFNGVTRASIVKINSSGVVDSSFNPLLQATSFQFVVVQKIITDGAAGLFISGSFASIGGVARDGIAKLLPSGALDSNWTAGQSGQILFRGNGGPANLTEFLYLVSGGMLSRVRVDNGQLDASFSPPAQLSNISNGAQDGQGRIYIARLTNSAPGHLFRLLPSGALDSSWQPVANGQVHGLLIDPQNDGQSYFTGTFTQVNSVARNGFVRINSSGIVDSTWNPPGSFYPIEELAFDANTNVIYAANGPINRYAASGSGTPDPAWNYDVSSGINCVRLVRPSLALVGNNLWVSGPATFSGPKAMSRILINNGAIQNEFAASGINFFPISKISPESDGFYLGVECQIHKFNSAGIIEQARPLFGNLVNLASESSGNLAYEFSTSGYRRFPFSGLVGMQWSTGTNGPFPTNTGFDSAYLGLLGNSTYICCGFNGLPGIQKRAFANGAIDPAWINPAGANFKVTPAGVYTWGSGNAVQRRNLTTGSLDFSIPVLGVTDVVIAADGSGYAVGPNLNYSATAIKSKIIKFDNTGVVDLNYPAFSNISSSGPYRAALDAQGGMFVVGDIASTTRQGLITKLAPNGQQDSVWAPRSLGFGTFGSDTSNGSANQMLVQGNRLIILGSFNFADGRSRQDLVAFPTSVFPTTTTIASDAPDPSAVNQTYTVAVSVTSPNGVPDETVSISDGTGANCVATLVNGAGSCQLTSTTSGLKTLTAAYLTTTVFAGSTGTTLHNVAVPTPTTTIITSDQPDPSLVDQPYSVVVSVSSTAGTPTGNVAVNDGSGASCNATLTGGSGSCQLISTSVGNKTLSANYPESAAFGASSDSEAHVVNGPNTPSIQLTINGSSAPTAVNPGRMGLALEFAFTGANPTSCLADGTSGTTWPVTTFNGQIVSGSQSFLVHTFASGTQTFMLSCSFPGFATPISASISLPISGSAVSGGVSLGSISAANTLPNGVFRYLIPVTAPGVPTPTAFISAQPANGTVRIVQFTSSQMTLDFELGTGQSANRSLQMVRIVAGNGSNGDEFPYSLVVPEPAPLFVNGFEGIAQVQGNAASTIGRLSISGDGRYSVFSSVASNLVVNDTNSVSDVFVYDATNKTTRRVSVANATEGNGASTVPVISQDGRYIAYQSTANNLVSGDTNGVADIFLYDQFSRSVRRVNVDALGQQANQVSSNSSISADGRFVAFTSSATNLVTLDTNSVEDVFLFDNSSKSIRRLSVSSAGVQGNLMSFCPCAISADGDVVSFQSEASVLVTSDSNNSRDVFVRRIGEG